MGTSLLLVSTASRWYGTARIPRGLAKAGFDVALLTPRNSLVEKSRFIALIDGSVSWVKFANMYYLHSWTGDSTRKGYFYQLDIDPLLQPRLTGLTPKAQGDL